MIVTQLNECQCCATSCYTVIATNNSPNTIFITATPSNCFGSRISIASGATMYLCVNAATVLSYDGGDAADLTMEFSQCNCEL